MVCDLEPGLVGFGQGAVAVPEVALNVGTFSTSIVQVRGNANRGRGERVVAHQLGESFDDGDGSRRVALFGRRWGTGES